MGPAEPPEVAARIRSPLGSAKEPLESAALGGFANCSLRPDAQIVTIGEGQTILQNSPAVAAWCGMTAKPVVLQYEGLNPSGALKTTG